MRPVLLLLLPLAIAASAFAASINFDSLSDGEILTNQYSAQGLLFSNAIALTSGFSLNEFELPPHSSPTVISDAGGPISISFANAQTLVSAYITYLHIVTVEAFDASGSSLGSVVSAAGCISNLALSGTPGCAPNELLSVSAPGAIRKITITGDNLGGSFALDDLSFDSSTSPEIPEPSSVALVAGAFGFLRILRCRFCNPSRN